VNSGIAFPAYKRYGNAKSKVFRKEKCNYLTIRQKKFEQNENVASF